MKQVIDKWADVPFSYGRDCCQFVGECVEAMTGHNPVRDFEEYDGEIQAQALIGRYGSLANCVRSVLGEPDGNQEDGAVCLLEFGDREVVGVVYQGYAIFRTETGISELPIERASLSWGTHA